MGCFGVGSAVLYQPPVAEKEILTGKGAPQWVRL